MRAKVQIIGKVTGLERERCVAKFKISQDMLELAGLEVINPTVLVPEETTWKDAMRICLNSLMKVDAVAIQPDWYDSEGARTEYMVANALGLKIIRI
jgi:hypothetical protein